MFITTSLLILIRFRIKGFDFNILIPNFDSLFTYDDKILVLITKNLIKSSQKSKQICSKHTVEHASVRDSGAVCTNHLSNHHARQLNDAVT